MTKANKENTTKKNWFKSAALPWIIIAVFVISSSSFVAGWHLSLNHSNSFDQAVKNRASAIVESKDQL